MHYRKISLSPVDPPETKNVRLVSLVRDDPRLRRSQERRASIDIGITIARASGVSDRGVRLFFSGWQLRAA